MSIANLPSVEQVKEWSREKVKMFLQERKDELDSEDDDTTIKSCLSLIFLQLSK